MGLPSIAAMYPGIEMNVCPNFSYAITLINFILFFLLTAFFLHTRKRTSMCFTLIRYCQLLFMFSLMNYIKDDCLSRIFESFDSFFFFRIVRWIRPFSSTSMNHNYLNLYVVYDKIHDNLIDFLLYGTLLCGLGVISIAMYLRNVTARVGLEIKTKSFANTYCFGVLIKFLCIAEMPLWTFAICNLYNFHVTSWNNIVFGLLLIVFLLGIVGGKIALLNTNFSFYLRKETLIKFGAAYIHMNFFDLRKLSSSSSVTEQESRAQFFSIARNGIIFDSAFGFLYAVTLVFFQYTSSLASIIFFMFFSICNIAIIIFMMIKNDRYFWSELNDFATIFSYVSIFIICIFASINYSGKGISGLSYTTMVFLFACYIILFVITIVELWSDQKTDFVFKQRKGKGIKTLNKEEYLKMLKAENIGGDLEEIIETAGLELDGIDQKALELSFAENNGDTSDARLLTTHGDKDEGQNLRYRK